MRIASVAEVKSRFSAFVKESAGGPVVVTRNGKPVAVLVGVTDEEEIERLLMAYSPRLRSILDESRRQISAGQGLDHEEFWSEFDVPEPPPAEPGLRRRAHGRRPSRMTPVIQRNLIEKLADLRRLSPDVRFGQLLANLGFLVEGQTDQSFRDVEDDRLLEVMESHRADLARRQRDDA